MITYLFNKLPAVRRLRADLAAAQAQIETKDRQLAHERTQHNGTLHREAELRETLTDTKRKRSELQRQFDDLRELTIKQAASIDVLRGDANEKVRQHREANALGREDKVVEDIEEQITPATATPAARTAAFELVP
jgi:uncharacterized coiled-coil DUF342 family protein